MASPLLERAANLFGCQRSDADRTARRQEIEAAVGVRLPQSVADLLLFPGIMEAVAAVHQGDPMFPTDARLLSAGAVRGCDRPLLWLLAENQGVCHWGAPFDLGDDPPVIVCGSMVGGERSLEFAPNVAVFIFAFAWDRSMFWSEPLIQAQASVLDSETLGFLRRKCRQEVSTYGWPGDVNYRFQAANGVRIELWNATSHGCDWWLTGPAPELEATVASLLPYSDLRESFWSNDV